MTDIGKLTSEIYGKLKTLEAQEVNKIFKAVLSLLGCASDAPSRSAPSDRISETPTASKSKSDAAAYFSEKSPKTKAEELAVAARFREKHSDAREHSKADFETFFEEAKQNFDGLNFSQDMRNAKASGYFTKGAKKSHKHKLSYAGQNFVDALPDRETAKKLKKTPRRKKQASQRKKGTTKEKK